jgi:hypothetical protein
LSIWGRFSLAERELNDRTGDALTPEIREVFARHHQHFVERIGDLDSLGSRLDFDPALSVRRILIRVSDRIKDWLDVSTDLEGEHQAYGNPWLFEHAVESTLWQVFTFLRTANSRDLSRRFRVQIWLKQTPENAFLLAIAHDGPAISPALVPFLFWYKIHSAEKGTGMGLALTGFEYRSLEMYPRASSEAPAFLQNSANNFLTTWFTIHIPLR